MKQALDLIMETAPWLVYIITFLFGVAVGSFLNVCIYRIPKHESIVTVPSHCMSCGKKLHWYELIPLFSWLALRGKCHGCKAKISAQYPVIEAANGLLCVLTLFVKGLSVDMVLTAALGSVLLVISIIDARTKEIPFPLVIAVGILGAIRLVFYHEHWLNSVLGAVVMGALFLIIIIVTGGKALGGGDFKLVIAAGLFVGLKNCVIALFLASFFGSVIHLTLMKVKKMGRELAFGPYLSFGFFTVALWGDKLFDFYLNIIGIK
ncbi:MAG: prepilin peptidase [Clostridia bacterium]|nr:prepilin peptidase [Clostridia bacterium]